MSTAPETYRFGEFELDMDAQQLRKGAEAVRLERRPFDLLVMLVRRRGSLVAREEIIAALWPGNVIIDFDSGLNTLVRKVRNALGDSPEAPHFILTVPGRGYRFIATIEEPGAATPTEPPAVAARPGKRPWRIGAPALAILIIVAAIVTWQRIDHEPGPIRIAILPFENLTGDESLGYLASGIAEDTNTSLAQVDLPNLRVIGIVSARAIAESDLPLQAIGQQLGVDHVVASSLRLEQSRIRVTSRLIRVEDGEQLWSASFDRELTNLLGLQRELSVAIAEQVRLRLSPSVAAGIDARQTRNRTAYELYLKGRFEWTRFQPGSVQRSLDWYRQAVAVDPEYALAWAGIARALITSVVTVEADPREIMPAAREALQHALEFGEDLPETQLALASFRFFLELDLAAAEEAARRSVALDHNSAMSHMFLGIVLSETGNHVEARAMLRRARELDPLFPLMFANSAVVALRANEPAEAYEFATQAIAINPEFWVGYLHRGSAQIALGDYEGALESFAYAEKYSGGNSARATASRAHVLAITGRAAEAQQILRELLAATDRNVPPYYVAIVYAALGENDMAFNWLEQGLATSTVYCLDIATDRLLDTLRPDERLEELVARCKRSLGRPAPDVTR
jgi:TolB-like protein/DNA-binding winged helix-turn-helix (wHTH) protein/Flp pilus assembly protein TadD